jgi:hypothetical protein
MRKKTKVIGEDDVDVLIDQREYCLSGALELFVTSN